MLSFPGWITGVAVVLLASGCAGPSTVRREPPVRQAPLPEVPVAVEPGPAQADGPTPAPPPRDPFAPVPDAFRTRARSLEEQGDLRSALLSWRVVHAFRPDDREAGERAARLERETRSRADGHLRAGKEHHREGRYATARAQFLAALAWDPDLAEAAEYLRHRMDRADVRTYITKAGDTPESVAREVYADPRGGFLVTYFTGVGAGAAFPPGTNLSLPVDDVPVAGGPRVPARVNAPVPSYGPVRAPAPAASPRATVALPPAQPPAAPTSPDGTLDRAQASLRAGDYAKAATLADAALARSPGNREARELRNAAYYQLGIDALRRQEYPDALRMLRKVDASYRDQKNLVSQVESRSRKEADSHYAAGLKFFLAEDLEGAVREWETTLKLAPEHAKAKKDLEKARRLLEQVKTM
jgi:hypothetical protein